MAKIQRIVFALVLIACIPAETFSQQSKKTIQWQIFDAPPNFIFEGNYKGQGFVEQLLGMIIDHSPQFNHLLILTSQNRALDNIRAGQKVCHPSLVETEARKTFIQFSRPLFISPTNRLVVRRDYIKNKSVDLRAFLSGKQHHFAVIKNRSYGSTVDSILQDHPRRHDIMYISNETSDYVFNLLGAERIDGTVAYVAELAFYQATSIDKALIPLETREIADNIPFVSGRIGCPNNAWGKSVVRTLNPIIAKLAEEAEFQRKMSLWWPNDALSEAYLNFYQSTMLAE